MIQKKEHDGHITTFGRKHLNKHEFALPPNPEEKERGEKGSYPIDTIARARNALARVAQFGTPAEQEEVRAKVHKKYPQINLSKR